MHKNCCITHFDRHKLLRGHTADGAHSILVVMVTSILNVHVALHSIKNKASGCLSMPLVKFE